MGIETRARPELQDLFAQLARHFRANESTISAEQVTTSLQCLSANEISALDRLFCLLYQGKIRESEPADKAGRKRFFHAGRAVLSWQHGQQVSSGHDGQPAVPSSKVAQGQNLASTGSEEVSGFSSATALHAPGLAAERRTEPASLCAGGFDVSRMGLATCREIDFSPSTERLLRDCKHNPGEFLRAIKEAKAAFPTGQGWEAAIATKRENADIRDLMKIYHRFECYNIYTHVVEAGFHTGAHWIRDMRLKLVNKLCKDFPERFHNQRTANKCLNWVDQGCRYHEWAEMLSETLDLGYLVALPIDVSHSAYTSRCTKEQMSAAALRLRSLGINELVKNLELSNLGNHIARKLKEMTGKKRKMVDDELIQSSRKSPRMTPPLSMLAPASSLHSSQKTMPSDPIVADLSDNHRRPNQTASGPWGDDSTVTYDLFNNFRMGSQGYSDVFLDGFPAFTATANEWC
ncbi:hypothetical protein NOR_06201 [Metarhizium rileyi]|uniref:Uncharacterized protein n=1 Tax=Metarhizium rileyi (strain RCEF 4871) TaxID=1649241 RepID=A0A167AVA8_METRR|nr:hypothetical protein NOR_06201 [Metarhizium rileyi RCEF 4871]